MVVGSLQGGGRLSQDARCPSTPAQRKQCLFQALSSRPSFLSIRGRNARATPTEEPQSTCRTSPTPFSSSRPRPHTPTPPHPVCLHCSAGGRDRGGGMNKAWCSGNGSRWLITPGNRQDHSEVPLILSPPEKLKLISGSPPPPKLDSPMTKK